MKGITMGRPRKDKNEDGLPPEPKPKKLFKMEFTIFDNDEIVTDLSGIRYREIGGNKSWQMEPTDFTAAVASTLGDKKQLLNALLKALDISEEQLRISFAQKDKAANQASAVGSAMSSAQSSPEPKVSDDDFDLDDANG